jgi:hypothetical protein
VIERGRAGRRGWLVVVQLVVVQASKPAEPSAACARERKLAQHATLTGASSTHRTTTPIQRAHHSRTRTTHAAAGGSWPRHTHAGRAACRIGHAAGAVTIATTHHATVSQYQITGTGRRPRLHAARHRNTSLLWRGARGPHVRLRSSSPLLTRSVRTSHATHSA